MLKDSKSELHGVVGMLVIAGNEFTVEEARVKVLIDVGALSVVQVLLAFGLDLVEDLAAEVVTPEVIVDVMLRVVDAVTEA